MKKRVISEVIALLIVIPIILLGGYTYYFAIGVVSIIGFYEMIRAYERTNKIPMVMKVLSLVSYLCIILSSVTSKTFDLDYRLIILNIFLCLIPIVGLKKEKYDTEDALFLLAITLFLGLAFNYLIVVRNISLFYLLYVVLVTIMTDIFAHFWGSKIGRIKLCPSVSPQKTVEGMIGGTILGTFIGSIFFLTFIDTTANILLVSIISLCLSLIAGLGDLVFSAIKRHFGIKDFSNIMPGHGGILDRLDSILLAILAFSYLVSFF